MADRLKPGILIAAVILMCAQATIAQDPLPSWKDTTPKKAILPFVERVTKEGSAEFVPMPERIATFDNDGTLWEAWDKQEPSPSPSPNPSQTDIATKPKQKKRGEFVIAPIPIANPAIGSGLILGLGYIFQVDKNDTTSAPSVIGALGMRTNNGSRAGGLGGSLHFKKDQYRVAAFAGRFDINADFFGVGQFAGNRGIEVPLNFSGKAFLIQGFYRIHSDQVYVGARLQIRDLSARLNRDGRDLPDDIIDAVPGDLLQAKTVAIGPRFLWDTRDNSFYPTKGHQIEVGANFFGKGIGSRFTYQTYSAAFNKYVSLNKDQIIAYRVMACSANGDRVPIYDLCLYGSSNDLRGYAAGQYQDRRMFATQAEYRRKLFWRFGIVAFGGVGGIARELNQFRSDQLLPAAGAGIRFRLTKINPINLRIDYGRGRGSHTLSIGVTEAF